GYEAIPSNRCTAWTLLPLPEQGIASPLSLHQPWVRNDDEKRVVIGRRAGYETAPLSCVIEWTLFSFHGQGIALRLAEANTLDSR
ncbi:MAG: hypothetical protein MJA30_37305, partial [Cytophagales bacterium]|nr:hypothetical protein [Cytophagales bacterium]